MTTAHFSLPTGWTYSDFRQFLESELQEDFGGGNTYLWLRDFDDATVTYSGADGALYQRSYVVANNDVTWGQPVEVVARTEYQKVAEMAAFSVGEATDAGDYVLRSGKVFEVGDYPDKGFSLSTEEARQSVASFTPVPNDIEHRPSILDGKLGELRTVALSGDGKSLIGTVAIPKWLHESIGDAPLKTSLAFDRATKRIAKNGLVLTPRVTDAALFGAYAEFAGKRHSQADQDRLNAIAEHAVALGADHPPKGQAKMSQSNDSVSVLDAIKALVTGRDTTPVAPATAAVTPKEHVPMSTTTPTTAEFAAMQAELQALKEGSARDTAGRIAAEAAHFAQDMLTARRITPAMKPAVEALFARALTDDAQDGATVTFARTDGEKVEGNRAAVLRAVFAASPEHKWLGEAVPKGDLIVLSNDGDKPADPLAQAAADATAWAHRENGTN